MSRQYRKRPVVIEAVRFDGTAESFEEVFEWLDANGHHKAHVADGTIDRLVIPTLEGDMRAMPGDWIIRGVHGEFYPCKPAIFDATYEAVEDHT